ncbi:hypothetical protein DV515_00011200 [Chloebia gouldiae]|uniref:Uncharacterized protein n=1 Tax=Chloebia gouldiae TaxID=44316 RepID=A0A3L8S766_CHLGU|nr:hypothetical protein DV515_00011200 [Chloebia gouldiae]
MVKGAGAERENSSPREEEEEGWQQTPTPRELRPAGGAEALRAEAEASAELRLCGPGRCRRGWRGRKGRG